MFKKILRKINLAIQKIVIILLLLYKRLISPLLGSNCRFHPSCSDYAREAIEQYGILKGTWLACKRLLKCHPLHEGGVDPVPTKIRKK